MRHLLYLITVFLFVVSCSSTVEHNMLINGQINGLKKGTVLLQKVEDTLLVSVDSIVIDGTPTFQFGQTIDSPEMFYLYLRLDDGTLSDQRIAFFGEPGEIGVTTSLKKFGLDVVITGSENQERLKEYDKLMQRYTDKNLELAENLLNAAQQGNDSLVRALQEAQNKTTSRQYLATVNFAVKYKDHEVAPYLMLTEAYNVNIKYLDTVYAVLSPAVKESKYGEDLASYISDIKKNKEE